MTRDALEAFVVRQLRNLAPASDPKALDITRIVIMAQVDAHLAREVEAAIERLAGAEPHAPHG